MAWINGQKFVKCGCGRLTPNWDVGMCDECLLEAEAGWAAAEEMCQADADRLIDAVLAGEEPPF